MTTRGYLKTATVLAAAGTAFSGYLSGVKLLTGACAFNETCPYFLGYPACWYGFGMFLAMLVFAGLGLAGRLKAHVAAHALAGVSAIGALFAGYFVANEIWNWTHRANPAYGLVLPTCVYGLVFYVAILALSIAQRPKKAMRGAAPAAPQAASKP